MAAAENRAKKYMKETAWMKFERLNELGRHRWRINHMKASVDTAAPHMSPHVLVNQKRADIEEVLGGASNWIGTYSKSPKQLCDSRPWRRADSTKKGDPAPFSTLKLTPRGEDGKTTEGERDEKGEKGDVKGKKKDNGGKNKECKPCQGDDGWTINCGYKMRVIERNLMEMRERIHWIHKNYSLYSPKERKYLTRGEAPWKKPPRPTTVDEKLAQIRKWSMKHHAKPKTAPAVSSGFFCVPSPATKSQGEGIDDGVAQLSISSVTEEEAAKSPELAQLKAVQEAGDPNF